jgi:NAD(P)H dehydrogenase (quinone)
MVNVNLAIIYYSSTGANYQMAQWAEEGGKKAGAVTKVLKVEELAPESSIDSNPHWKKNHEATKDVPTVSLVDLEWADAIIFSIPTRYGNLPAQMKQFLDSTGGLWFQGKLANKVVSAMSTAMNAHGGQEATIHALYTTMHHWGAIIASPGYTDQSIFTAGGNPYGTSASVSQEGKIQDDVRKAVIHQAERTVKVAEWIKLGMQAAASAGGNETKTTAAGGS